MIDLDRDGRGIWLSQKYLTVSQQNQLTITRVMRSPAEALRDTLVLDELKADSEFPG